MRYTEYNVGKAREYLIGKNIRFKFTYSDIVQGVCTHGYINGRISVKGVGVVHYSEKDTDNIKNLERLEVLDEQELKEGDIVYIGCLDRRDVFKTRSERIYLCTIPGKAIHKYVCVASGEEEKYRNGEKFKTRNIGYVIKKPKEENNGEFNITIDGKKYKGSTSILEECN